VLEAGVEEERVDLGARALLVEVRVEDRARERRAELGQVPADRRVGRAVRGAAHEHLRLLAGLLDRDVVEHGLGAELRRHDSGDQPGARAEVALVDGRSRARAEHDDDARKDRVGMRLRLREDELDRRLEDDPGRDPDECAAVLERGRERGEFVAGDAFVERRDRSAVTRIADGVGEWKDDDARIARRAVGRGQDGRAAVDQGVGAGRNGEAIARVA